MAVTGTHHGMPLSIDDLDIENLAYFQYCADHEFRLQRCAECRLFRYPPGTACPFCTCPDSEWVAVEGKGEVHSYGEVHQAIQPAFREQVLLAHDLCERAGAHAHSERRVGRDLRHAGGGGRLRVEEVHRASLRARVA